MGLASITMVAGLGFAALGSTKSGLSLILPTKKAKPKKTGALKQTNSKTTKEAKEMGVSYLQTKRNDG